MTTITLEQRIAIKQAGGLPAIVLDADTNTEYVLLRADLCHSVRPLPEADDGLTGDEMLRQMWEVMKDDWDDPSMDVYDSEVYA